MYCWCVGCCHCTGGLSANVALEQSPSATRSQRNRTTALSIDSLLPACWVLISGVNDVSYTWMVNDDVSCIWMVNDDVSYIRMVNDDVSYIWMVNDDVSYIW